MIVISNESACALAKHLAYLLKLEFIRSSIKRFSNFEIEILIPKFNNSSCLLVIGASKNINNDIIELIFFISELRKRNINDIYLLIPYVFYGRQCEGENKYGPLISFLIDYINNQSFKKVIVIDVHDSSLLNKLNDVVEICHYDLFQNLVPYDSLIVAPDEGSSKKLIPYSIKNFQTISLNKSRDLNGKIKICGSPQDFYRKDCIIIDDIVDSASTICSAARFLEESGAIGITALVSHNLINFKSMGMIAASPVETLIVTDTINWDFDEHICKNIRILKIGTILVDRLKVIFNKE